ncbi:MAG: hypothetical protein HRU77_01715 [Gammaproteobacteria bacterium]|nr:MAG: hypothetical protein HRU77_01715 [Gammaproteobacteria bacterium]
MTTLDSTTERWVDSLGKGKLILCWVWNYEDQKQYQFTDLIKCYRKDSNYHYIPLNGVGWIHARPIKLEEIKPCLLEFPIEIQTIVPGQIFKHPNFGLVKFKRLDYYHGECTAELEGIEFHRTYYQKIELMMELGFTIMDK